MNNKELKDSIKIPKSLDEYILNGIEKGRMEKKYTKKRNKISSISKVASILVIGGIGIGVMNPDVVRAIPIIGQVLKGFDSTNFGEPIDKYVKYTKGVDLVSENKDAKVTLSDVIIDENIFMLGFTIESDKLVGFEGKNPHDFINVGLEITLNGKTISSYGHSARKINENTGAIILRGNIAELELEDEVKVEATIDSIRGASGEVSGKWDFNFETSKIDNSRRIILNQEYNIKEKELKLNEIIMSPLTNTVMFSGKDAIDGGVLFGAKYKVIDSEGNLLRTDFGGSALDTKTGEYSGKLEILDDLSGTSYIDIIPYWGSETIDKKIEGSYKELLTTTGSGERKETLIARKPTAEEVKDGYALTSVYYNLNLDNNNEFLSIDELRGYDIKVNNKESVTIKDIEVNNESTKISMKINGGYNYNYLGQLVIFDEEMNDIGSWEGHIGAVLEDEKEGIYSITLDKLDTSKKYKIAIPMTKDVDLSSEYSMRINLD